MNTWAIGKSLVKHHYQRKKDLYSHLNMEDITGSDETHAKRVCEDFQTKGLGNAMSFMFKIIHYC